MSREHYNIYRPSFEFIGAPVRVGDLTDGEFYGMLRASGDEMVARGAEARDVIGSGIHAIIERDWDHDGRETLFVAAGMADFLDKISVEDMSVEDIGLPKNPFCICWHPTERRRGRQLPSLLVDDFSYPHAGDSGPLPGMAMVYRHPETGKTAVRWMGVSYKSTGAPAEKGDEWGAVVADLSFKLFLYMKAFPNLVRDGVPSDIKPRCERQAGRIGARTIDLHPKARMSPSSHPRMGHFRVLRDPRFKRKPDGTCVVLLIDPTVVGSMKPKFVKGPGEGQEADHGHHQ
jgi:hypothetical protein